MLHCKSFGFQNLSYYDDYTFLSRLGAHPSLTEYYIFSNIFYHVNNDIKSLSRIKEGTNQENDPKLVLVSPEHFIHC